MDAAVPTLGVCPLRSASSLATRAATISAMARTAAVIRPASARAAPVPTRPTPPPRRRRLIRQVFILLFIFIFCFLLFVFCAFSLEILVGLGGWELGELYQIDGGSNAAHKTDGLIGQLENRTQIYMYVHMYIHTCIIVDCR